MDTTARPNPAGAPIPESIGDGTESARSRSVPGAELPTITAREGQVALTEQALRTHAGSDLYPITGSTDHQHYIPYAAVISAPAHGNRPVAFSGSIAQSTSYFGQSGVSTPAEP